MTERKMIDIVGNRKYFFTISIVLILAGIVGYLVNGLQLDIQFQGGTIIQMQMNDDTFDIEKAKTAASDAINKNVDAQKLEVLSSQNSSEKIHLLMLKISSEDTLTEDELNKVVSAMRTEFNLKQDAQMQVQSVQPFIGKELMQKGILASIVASILIVLYVWWRFSSISGLSAAVMALVALFHDIMVMFAVYTIFKIPVNESFIAAVLTILGYSINDTIVIYDRIRENTRLMRKVTQRELVNTSIMQTMSRTINTSVTTFLSVFVVYIFASVNNITSLKEFTLPLLVGIVSGVYSTVFIASPLWLMWKEHKAKVRAVKS